MAAPYLQDSEPPPDEDLLDRIETDLGMEFPPSYRTFLLERNGGVFSQEVVYMEEGDEDDDTKWVCVHELYGIATERILEADFGLVFHLKTLRDRVPREFIPIGGDGGGDQLCLGVTAPYTDMVWIWNHEGEGEDLLGNMSLVSGSFSGFMEGLRFAPGIEYEESDAVFRAIETGDMEQLKFLLSQSVPMDVRNAKGHTPLQFAAWIAQSNVIDMLIEQGSKVDDKDQSGKTPLALAADQGSVDIVARLLRAGAEVDSRDNEGNTPLMHAARGAVQRVIKHLIDAGADVNAERHDGMSPLMLCFHNELSRRLLLDAGAKARLGEVSRHDVPHRVPDDWSRDDIVNAIRELSTRIEATTDKMVEFGNKRGHGDQLQEELQFLNQLRRRLKELDSA